MKTLIQNGTLVLPDGERTDNLWLEDGTIAAIGGSGPTDCTVLDAAGCLVFPGFIDPHTHLEMDNGVTVTADDFASGTAAALAGGTTCLIDFATQTRGGTLTEALALWHSRAAGRSSCDYGFHMAITDWNAQTASELPQMLREGVSSFKLYMAYDNLRVSDAAIYETLRAVGALGGLVGVHCENGELINELTAGLRA
ncbi:MAG: amidohydrolase family protein, partial [Oscillospiraceae bacterium]